MIKYMKNVQIWKIGENPEYYCWDSKVIALDHKGQLKQLIPDENGVVRFKTSEYNCIFRTHYSGGVSKETIYFRY